jgi:hypothetical protein
LLLHESSFPAKPVKESHLRREIHPQQEIIPKPANRLP